MFIVKSALLTCIFFALYIKSVAQTNFADSDIGDVKVKSSDSYSIEKKGTTKILTFAGRVAIEVDNLEIAKADTIRLNVQTQKLFVYGNCEFTYTGKISYNKVCCGDTQYIEYSLSDKTMQIKNKK